MSLEEVDRALIDRDSVALFLGMLSNHPHIGMESLRRTVRNNSRFSPASWSMLKELMIDSGLCAYDQPNDSWTILADIEGFRSVEEFVASPRFFEAFFGVVMKRFELGKIFNEESVRSKGGGYYVRRSCVPYHALPVVHWLKGLDFFEYVTTDDMLRIRDEYASVFKISVLSELGVRFGMTPEEFERIRKIKAENGARAEEFVLTLERARFESPRKRRGVRRVSLVDVGAGYDIESFLSEDSDEADKFIEVKSFTGKARFYWSQGEYEAAKRLKEAYFIYLVQTDRIGEPGYTPRVLRNPATLLEGGSEWKAMPENWLVVQGGR